MAARRMDWRDRQAAGRLTGPLVVVLAGWLAIGALAAIYGAGIHAAHGEDLRLVAAVEEDDAS